MIVGYLLNIILLHFITETPAAGVVNSAFVSDTANTNTSAAVVSGDPEDDGIPVEV